MDMIVNVSFDLDSRFQTTLLFINQNGEMETFNFLKVNPDPMLIINLIVLLVIFFIPNGINHFLKTKF